jgi:hypothetical protein
MKHFILIVALGALVLPAFAAREKDTGPVATLSFVVLKDTSGKPVRNAGVVMHLVGKHDKQARGGIELKTDAAGKCSFEGVPYGKLRVQVLAPGYQTFGEDYEVDQRNVEITIKLKRPNGQYSIYDDHPKDTKKDTNPPPDSNSKPQL